MSNTAVPFGEIRELVASLHDGQLDVAGQQRLEHLVVENVAARRYYLQTIFLLGKLHRTQGGLALEEGGDENAALRAPCSESNSQSLIPNPSFIPPIITDSTPSALVPIGSFIFSHVAAALILGIGLLIGLAWRISLPAGGNPSPRSPDIAHAAAHITALVNCEWTKQGSEIRGPGSGISEIQIPKSPNPQIPVFLGDRFLVSSGLMQITYNSGAKVILEGPCTYEIDSNRGGYLAVGKLTAKVEKGSGIRGPGSGNANTSPLFAVRTPTAVVTDLGTEFGVEVEQSGATRSHVFQGKVELRENSRGLTTPGASPLILHAGESAHVKRGRNNQVAITREPGQPNHFIRQIHQGKRTANHQSSNPQFLIPNPFYRLIDLGTLGGARSSATHINSRGQVVGWAETPAGVVHAFLYADGRMRDLGALADDSSGANFINNHGVVVGDTGLNDNRKAFVYRGSKMVLLPTLGGRYATANAINDRGTIAGMSQTSGHIERAFVYTERDGMKDLGALGGPKAQSMAQAVNAAGTIVGMSETHDDMVKGFIYVPDAGMKAIGTFGGIRSAAYGINDAGQIAGYSCNRDSLRLAFLFDNHRGLTEIHALGRPQGTAMDINNNAVAVGYADDAEPDIKTTRAFLYRDGKCFDLNQMVIAADGWTLSCAAAINDAGQIVGFGRSARGEVRAFLLTPVNEGLGARGEGQGIEHLQKTDNR